MTDTPAPTTPSTEQVAILARGCICGYAEARSTPKTLDAKRLRRLANRHWGSIGMATATSFLDWLDMTLDRLSNSTEEPDHD